MIGFETLTAMAFLTSGLAEAIDRLWHLDGMPSAIRMLVISIILGNVGTYFDLGMFADPTVCSYNDWVCGTLIGAGAGVTTAIGWLSGVLRAVWEFLGIRPRQ